MTNSHNRTNSHQAEITGQSSTTKSSSSSSSSSGRFFANNGKQHCKPPGSAKKQQQQSNSANVSLNSSRGSSNDKFFVSLKNGMGATSTPGKSRASPQQHRSSPTGGAAAVLAQLSSSPPNLSHFAGSKCYDAPAPTALPKPPLHWTGGPQDVIMMSVPVPPAAIVTKSTSSSSPAQQKSQTYYQKASKSQSAKKQAGAPHQRQQHAVQHNPLAHHHQMVSCSREYLLKAVSARSTAGGGCDYDRFSENLKMVLNVRA